MKQLIIIFLIFTIIFPACKNTVDVKNHSNILPDIFPDYKQVTVPINIAPLNFRIKENSSEIRVEFSDKTGNTFNVHGKKSINIPNKKWKQLLKNSSDDSIKVLVKAKIDNEWTEFAPFSIFINSSPIDCGLVYRRIAPGYEIYSHMGIFQRDLTSFKETPVIENKLYKNSCVNCHSFCMNDPTAMMFHLRGKSGGTFLLKNGKTLKLNGKTSQTIGNFQYPYWHPNKNYIAYSVNKTKQDFHSRNRNRIEVYDEESDIIVYNIKKNTIITCDNIFSKNSFETWPTFSADGKYLYFASAKAFPMPQNFDKIKYSLCRIAFDAKSEKFGNKVDTIINAAETNKSIAFPRISPDGRFLMVTSFDYGNFPIWHKEADLLLVDLQTGTKRFIDEVNSNDVESYHSWSSNGKWFVFSSRRVNGLYTMPYISFFDKNGKAGKPFLLPQKNPDYYDMTLYSFNIPELVKAPVKLDISEIEKEMKKKGKNVQFKSGQHRASK